MLQINYSCLHNNVMGVEVAQWQEHSPLTSAARVRLPAWEVCELGLRSLSDVGGFLRVLQVELSSTFRNGLQQLTAPLHSVSPLQQLVSQFYDSFNKGACAHFLFFVPRSFARQVAEKIAQCNRASTPNLGNLQR